MYIYHDTFLFINQSYKYLTRFSIRLDINRPSRLHSLKNNFQMKGFLSSHISKTNFTNTGILFLYYVTKNLKFCYIVKINNIGNRTCRLIWSSSYLILNCSMLLSTNIFIGVIQFCSLRHEYRLDRIGLYSIQLTEY